jgi:hypothetical protein
MTTSVLASCATHTHRTRFSSDLCKTSSTEPSKSPSLLRQSPLSRALRRYPKARLRSRLSTTTTKTINQTILLHFPINKHSLRHSFPTAFPEARPVEHLYLVLLFLIPFFTFMLLSRFTESVRGYPTHTKRL